MPYFRFKYRYNKDVQSSDKLSKFGWGAWGVINTSQLINTSQMTNTSQKVFRNIRTRIIKGEYEIGTFLDAKQISDELLVSPAPIREAFVRLSERGLLDWQRNRGFQISSISAEDARSSLELLRVLYKCAMVRTCGPAFLKEFEYIEREEMTSYEQVITHLRAYIFTEFEMEVCNFQLDRIWKISELYLSNAETQERTLKCILRIMHLAHEQKYEKIGKLIDSIFLLYQEKIRTM